MVKLMTGIFAIFASFPITPNWGEQATKKTYEWVDNSVVSYEQLQKKQHCYTWAPLAEQKQKGLQQDKK